MSTNTTNGTFIQLDSEDCKYLLSLIAEMDSDTLYTAKQRGYTIPKLQKIEREPRSTHLAWQDVDYLLELIEDDEQTESEQQRFMTREKLEQIQDLQCQARDAMRSIEDQRARRRAKRNPAVELQKHFEQTA